MIEQILCPVEMGRPGADGQAEGVIYRYLPLEEDRLTVKPAYKRLVEPSNQLLEFVFDIRATECYGCIANFGY